MAHISGDEGLLRAFSEGIDVHRATASEVFGVAVREVSSEQRRYAKVINFGLIYGMGAFGLASNLGIEQKAARDYIDRYFARYPNVKRYMDRDARIGRREGLCRDAVRPAHLPARDPRRQRPAAQRRRTPGDQRADAGHGGRPDQARDARGAGSARPRSGAQRRW